MADGSACRAKQPTAFTERLSAVEVAPSVGSVGETALTSSAPTAKYSRPTEPHHRASPRHPNRYTVRGRIDPARHGGKVARSAERAGASPDGCVGALAINWGKAITIPAHSIAVAATETRLTDLMPLPGRPGIGRGPDPGGVGTHEPEVVRDEVGQLRVRCVADGLRFLPRSPGVGRRVKGFGATDPRIGDQVRARHP